MCIRDRITLRGGEFRREVNHPAHLGQEVVVGAWRRGTVGDSAGTANFVRLDSATPNMMAHSGFR